MNGYRFSNMLITRITNVTSLFSVYWRRVLKLLQQRDLKVFIVLKVKSTLKMANAL